MSTQTHAAIVAALQARWPEHKIGKSLARIEAFTDLLGRPQDAFPVIQITGTNGKGSTALMIESLLRALNLRVGRISSPHLVDVTERIAIDGRPIAADDFDDLVRECRPYLDMVDARQIDGIPLTFFEVITGLGYAAFANAPVDVAVVEVGMGGSWDATSVVSPQVAVLCPIDLDHTHILGTLPEIATEKAGIIKEGSVAVVARQQPEVARIVAERCAEVGARLVAEGEGFGVLDRRPAVGGQLVRVQAGGAPVEVLLPLFGGHMAHNAALAVAAVEAFLGGRALTDEVIADGLTAVRAPARLEVIHRGPTVVLDTCHNPHGARATIDGVSEAFDFDPLICVTAMMADKDADGVLEIFAEQVTDLICTTVGSTDRALAPEALAEIAEGHLDPAHVHIAATMADALDLAVTLADAAGGRAGVLVAGSVIAAGEARALMNLDAEQDTDPWTTRQALIEEDEA